MKNDFEKKVACPNCNRTVAFYFSGSDIVLKMKCKKCHDLFWLISAGKTYKEQDFSCNL